MVNEHNAGDVLQAELIRLHTTLDEIRDAVGADPDETTMQAIHELAAEWERARVLVRRLRLAWRSARRGRLAAREASRESRFRWAEEAAELQQQRAALWDLCKKIARSAMVERCKSCHDDGKELAALRASAVVLPADWREDIMSLPSHVEGQFVVDELFALVEAWIEGENLVAIPRAEPAGSWRPATVEAAPTTLCEKCRCRGVQDPDRPRSVFGHFCLNCIGACHDMSDESSIHACVIDRWAPPAAGVSGTGTEANDA
jgi:hypothetical protein